MSMETDGRSSAGSSERSHLEAEHVSSRRDGRPRDLMMVKMWSNAAQRRLRRIIALAFGALAAIVSGCGTARPVAPTFLERPRGTTRLMTWNVGRNSLFAGNDYSRPEQFARVMRAIRPDIVCLQDVWSDAARAAALFDDILPIAAGRKWQYHGVADTVILTPFDLSQREEFKLQKARGRSPAHAMALATDASGRGTYVVCAHFDSGDRGADARAQQAEAIVRKMRTLVDGGGVRRRTPIFVLGDLNAYDSSPDFVSNLQAGRVETGRAAPPDWNGKNVIDALPSQNGRGEVFWTWNLEHGEFPAARLDRVLFTGSVAVVAHAFVLNTTTMTDQELNAAGLQRDDVMFRASENSLDHLPVVVDFRRR